MDFYFPWKCVDTLFHSKIPVFVRVLYVLEHTQYMLSAWNNVWLINQCVISVKTQDVFVAVQIKWFSRLFLKT